MDYFFSAIIIGAVQGATEFLPVSSSGHLLLIRSLFGSYSNTLTLDVFFHFGSLLAILYFFREQLKPKNIKYLLKPLFITTIPVGILGVLIESYSIPILDSPYLLGFSFLATSLLLFSWSYVGKKNTTLKNITSKQAFIVGIFQAFALLPGISRSASTLVSSKLVGLKERDSFQYAFLVAIPALLGALVLVLKDGFTLNQETRVFAILGFASSFIVSLLALYLLKIIINNHKPFYFAWYTIILSALSFALFTF